MNTVNNGVDGSAAKTVHPTASLSWDGIEIAQCSGHLMAAAGNLAERRSSEDVRHVA